uniref:Acyl carrier protein n=1 Tax=Streptomyces sp. ML694-90F3 TaxID=1265536 RepID=A0A077KT18_9ACTN|nr:acyl carrier protein [Streptomyces sp. ML694-90F3]
MWDDRFEEVLRRFLPYLAESQEVRGSIRLRDVGLDSIAMVELLSVLEKEYDVRLDDEALRPETFETPATLWSALAAARA